ncbi:MULTISPECIES: hypothetical protein [Cyanophyceae]|nr:hypothetical protein [Nodosilinea sp. FACHB-141]
MGMTALPLLTQELLGQMTETIDREGRSHLPTACMLLRLAR